MSMAVKNGQQECSLALRCVYVLNADLWRQSEKALTLYVKFLCEKSQVKFYRLNINQSLMSA